MATFGDLQQRVSRRLEDDNNTAVSALDVADSINQAINYWKQEDFWFNQVGAIVNTVVDNPILDLASAGLLYLQPGFSFSIPYQNMVYDLTAVPPDYYDAFNLNETGRPYRYTYKNGQYYLYWIPDKVYTVNVSGIKDYAPIN
jgi:hypothetical protein